eukprot:tig00021221_g19353.t1
MDSGRNVRGVDIGRDEHQMRGAAAGLAIGPIPVDTCPGNQRLCPNGKCAECCYDLHCVGTDVCVDGKCRRAGEAPTPPPCSDGLRRCFLTGPCVQCCTKADCSESHDQECVDNKCSTTPTATPTPSSTPSPPPPPTCTSPLRFCQRANGGAGGCIGEEGCCQDSECAGGTCPSLGAACECNPGTCRSAFASSPFTCLNCPSGCEACPTACPDGSGCAAWDYLGHFQNGRCCGGRCLRCPDASACPAEKCACSGTSTSCAP